MWPVQQRLPLAKSSSANTALRASAEPDSGNTLQSMYRIHDRSGTARRSAASKIFSELLRESQRSF